MTFLFCIAIIVTAGSISFAEEIPIRIDGKVVRVDEGKRTLVVDYEIPASGEHVQQKFVVEEGAGFKDFKKLRDLKEGALVSLDYLDYKPVPKAVYIMHIPLEKTYFTHGEVAGALLKVKSNHKVAHVSEG